VNKHKRRKALPRALFSCSIPYDIREHRASQTELSSMAIRHGEHGRVRLSGVEADLKSSKVPSPADVTDRARSLSSCADERRTEGS
jgi:hypothetical protein